MEEKIIPIIKKYIKKNNEEKIYNYNQKKYNDTYYLKHKEKILTRKYKCECCNREYLLNNKSIHENSMKHKQNETNSLFIH